MPQPELATAKDPIKSPYLDESGDNLNDVSDYIKNKKQFINLSFFYCIQRCLLLIHSKRSCLIIQYSWNKEKNIARYVLVMFIKMRIFRVKFFSK